METSFLLIPVCFPSNVYTLNITSAAAHVFKKLPQEVKGILLEEAQIIKENPQQGEQLKGKYSFLRSLHCGFKGSQYRIIYQVMGKEIVIRLADTRENIYRRLDEMKLKAI